MPTPKSVIKVYKDKQGCSVNYESSVDQAEYYIFELTRAALRDVAKFVMKEWKFRYYSHFKKRTGNGAKAIYSKVWSSKSTKYPRVEIGLPHSYRGNAVKGFYSFFQEFGTKKVKKLGLLTNTVQDNIYTIRKIESQYLKYIDADDAVKDYVIGQAGNGGEEIVLENND